MVLSLIHILDQEEAWNYGFSSSFYIPVFGKTLNVNTEYYYTDFRRQMIIDLDTDQMCIRDRYNTVDKKIIPELKVLYPTVEAIAMAKTVELQVDSTRCV